MEDTRNRILKATYKAVRQYGLDGVRIQNISDLASLSPGALYRYFDSKETLLEICFSDVNKHLLELFTRISINWEDLRADPISVMRMIWRAYFRFWTARPDETVFYFNYCNTLGFRYIGWKYDKNSISSSANVFEHIKDTFPGLQKMDQTILFLHIFSTPVMYAKCVVEGILPDNEQTENEIFHLLMTGLSGFMVTE